MSAWLAEDAGDLVSRLHSRCVRLTAGALGHHTQGLTVAGKQLHKRGSLSHRSKVKLQKIDEAFHLTRHISSQSIEDFLQKLAEELSPSDAAPQDAFVPTDAMLLEEMSAMRRPSMPSVDCCVTPARFFAL